MKLILSYSQPRPASYDPEVVIYERKGLVLDPMTEAEAEECIESFLKKGSVVCGAKTYYRSMISLRPHHIPEPKPEPEFCSTDGHCL